MAAVAGSTGATRERNDPSEWAGTLGNAPNQKVGGSYICLTFCPFIVGFFLE